MRICKADIFLFRIPIDEPIKTSFGAMYDRPSLVIRLEDTDGCAGWGEVWCNFPSMGAEYRARLLEALVLPALADQQIDIDEWNAWHTLTSLFGVLAIQTGERGPFAQCIAAIDCAIWDMKARRKGLPLFRYLSSTSHGKAGIYASGINPGEVERRVTEAVANGFSAFKIKVGFGLDEDIANVALARNMIGPQLELMVDANQRWDFDTSLQFLAATSDYRLGWLEEPLRHDAPNSDWKRLSSATEVRLAAGENFVSLSEFRSAKLNRGIRVIQPDLGKWGGISGMRQLTAQSTADLSLCPHWLGGGVGLLTSLHAMSAHDSDFGRVEVDVNPNPARSSIMEAAGISFRGDHVDLPASLGIGDVEGGIAQLELFLENGRKEIRL